MLRQSICRTANVLQQIFIQSQSKIPVARISVRRLTQTQRQPTFPFTKEKSDIILEASKNSSPALSDGGEIDVASLLHRVLDTPRAASGRKLYPETENDGLRQGLRNMSEYAKTFGVASLRVSLPASHVVSLREQMCCVDQLMDLKAVIHLVTDISCLTSLARGRLMEDPVFEEFVNRLAERLKSSTDLTFLDLRNLLQAFHRFHFDSLPHNLPASNTLRSAIDAACIVLLQRLSREEAFILSDLWFLSSCSRLAEFPNNLVSSILHSSVSQLARYNIIRLLLAVALQRKVDPGLMLQAERALSAHVAALSVPELAVVCAAFFKTQTTPSLDFVDKILSRLLSVEIEGVSNDVAVALFAKFLNRYAQHSMHEPLQRFLQKCKTQVATLGMPALGHLCGIMESTLQAEEDFLFRVCHKVLDSMPDVRLKDQSKFASICSFFNFRPKINGEDFFLVLLRSSERSLRVEDVSTYPSKLVELLAAFAQMGCFSIKLLNFMTHQAFWRAYLTQPKSLLSSNALLQLHFAVEHEFPEIGRPLIARPVLKTLLAEEQARSPPLNTAVSSLFNGLQALMQEENKSAAQHSVALFSPLPYAEPMLLVRLKDLSPIPLPADLLTAKYDLRKPPNDGTCTIIMYHPWWDYTNPHQHLTGLSEMKIRHLKSLGYNVIEINQLDTHEMTFVKKVKYLRDKLFFETADIRLPRDYVSDKDTKKRTTP